MKRKSMRGRRAYYPADTLVKPARKLTTRHPWMGTLKCWVAQEPFMRWWNLNIRPAPYRPTDTGSVT